MDQEALKECKVRLRRGESLYPREMECLEIELGTHNDLLTRVEAAKCIALADFPGTGTKDLVLNLMFEIISTDVSPNELRSFSELLIYSKEIVFLHDELVSWVKEKIRSFSKVESEIAANRMAISNMRSILKK